MGARGKAGIIECSANGTGAERPFGGFNNDR